MLTLVHAIFRSFTHAAHRILLSGLYNGRGWKEFRTIALGASNSVAIMGAQPILSTNNVSHVRDVIVYSIIFMIISISVVATRMYVRVKIIKNPGPEDYTILMALVG